VGRDAQRERKARSFAAAIDIGDFAWAAEQGGSRCALPNQALGAQTVAEAWYRRRRA
jgi:hypothetical protein